MKLKTAARILRLTPIKNGGITMTVIGLAVHEGPADYSHQT
jgi:hypothetical protein